MYIALVEILHNIQHYKETKKVKQVIFWTELVNVPSETKAWSICHDLTIWLQVLYQQLLFVLLTPEC